MFTTGIPTCDALREIAFTGNIIPQIWYKVFVKRDLKSPKPHLLAINILADIVYWYRPVEVRDECTGAVIGYRKKFGGDMLQRNYAQISEQFGCSAGQAKDAIVFLEQMGVVRREFRTIETAGTSYNNILFIDLDADRLRDLTYPSAEPCADPCAEISPDGCGNSDTPVPKFHQRCVEISPEGCRNFDTPCAEISPVYKDYYTEITTENSTKISQEKSVSLTDGRVREQKTFEDVVSDAVRKQHKIDPLLHKLREHGKIPVLDLHQTKMLINWLCEIDWYMRNKEEGKHFQLFADCLCSMMTSRGEQIYCGDVVTSSDVCDAVYRLAPNLSIGELNEFAENIVRIFLERMDFHYVQNVKGYMKSVIWNGFSEFPVNREEYIA